MRELLGSAPCRPTRQQHACFARYTRNVLEPTTVSYHQATFLVGLSTPVVTKMPRKYSTLCVLVPLLTYHTFCSAARQPNTAPSRIGSSDPLPLLIWHGLGDSFDADGIQATANLAEEVNPGTFVYPIQLGDDGSGDRRATFFGNVTEQLVQVCDDIAAHPILSLAPAVNALGFSQGGQFLRGYIERCNKPPVKNLVTFGSQHNGISEFQTCSSSDWLCRAAMGLLTSNAWTTFVQGNLVPAQYFRDPEDIDSYLEHSNFLADINNERQQKSSSYKENLAALDKFVMYMFENDTIVHPKETSWFAEVNATSGEITPLQKRLIYREDWLGLKQLDEKGALAFKTTPGEHMRLDDTVLRKAFKMYFAPSGDTLQKVVSSDGTTTAARHAEDL